MKLHGWILDLYPNPNGMTLWLIDRNQNHHCLTDSFVPAFYVSGRGEQLARFEKAAEKQTTIRTKRTERTDLWLNAPREVVEVSVLKADEFMRWGYWTHRVDSQLDLYNSNLMVASLYCWEKRLFPLAYVEVETDENNRVANQLFGEDKTMSKKALIIYSDMRQSTAEFDLEHKPAIPTDLTIAKLKNEHRIPDLKGIDVAILGVDASARNLSDWQNLRAFWEEYFTRAGAHLRTYSVLRGNLLRSYSN